ncbi:Uncharacterized conserved protein, contains FIST_N domain [Arboricoccus pini]|uniref:Uncharacterized conserved protein, contains FIST_N domain n=1 Tax=Arboricoccus pini TaxID=1963835 RepID=A0A212RN96_9PROT|nr:FIST N-terminal domain-containing protein [Arboricoccus pini]SNB73883.1 Uncharacterized conserved protein, contains FIST_N domain [Arboricoccus pini]
MIRIGYGKHGQVQTAVEQCRKALGPGAPHLLLAFCGGKHAPAEAMAAIRENFGADVPVVGGSAAGAIARTGLGYTGLEIAIAAFDDVETLPSLHVAHGMDSGEFEAGERLGQSIGTAASDGAVVLLFYDSVAAHEPLRLHNASTLLRGINAGLAGKSVRLIGGGTLTNLNLSDGWVFDGTQACKHAAVALVFPPSVVEETRILHGCRPVSTFMKITSIDEAEVFELDGEPALQVIESKLGISVGDGAGEALSLIATLGEKHGDLYAPYDENSYVNRLILRADPNKGSITLFEEDFKLGSTVQIMGRDNALMLDSVRDGVAALNERLPHLDPFLVLYIDCAGRGSVRSGAPVEEAQLVVDGLGGQTPMLGFYSGVEVAPVAGQSRPLDWTGVLTVLAIR